MTKRIFTFNEFINEAYQIILEGKDTSKIKELIKKIKESDTEAIKSLPAYEKVMGWFENEGPIKGKSLVDSDRMVEYLEYWFGDLSSKTSDRSEINEESIAKLKDPKKVEKILKACQKASGYSEYLGYKIDLITKSAEEIEKAISELRKSGKEIGGKDSESGQDWRAHTTDQPEKYPSRLGIIPFSTAGEKAAAAYDGKDIGSGNAKQFKAWYKELEKNGVKSIIKKIKDPKYHDTRAVSLDEGTKEKILEVFQKKAEDRGKDIAEATKISWYPKEAEDSEKTTKEKISLKPQIITDLFSFPTGGAETKKGFFPEDKASIDDVPEEYKKDFSDSMKKFKSSIDEVNGEITKVLVKAVSSTSAVPSTYQSKKTRREGNEGLADDRIQTIKDLALTVLKENKMAVNLTYDETGKLPNNGPVWNDNSRKKYKDRKKNPSILKAYENEYGPYRYSYVEILITYKIEIPQETVREYTEYITEGDWKYNISWVKSTTPKKQTIFKNVRIKSGGGLYPTKPGVSCPTW